MPPITLPEPREATKMVALRMPISLWQRLGEWARRAGTDRTKLIIHLVTSALDEVEAQQAKGPGGKVK